MINSLTINFIEFIYLYVLNYTKYSNNKYKNYYFKCTFILILIDIPFIIFKNDIIYEKNNILELITEVIRKHQFLILLGDYELQRIFFKFFISASFLISMKKGKIIIL